MIVSLKQLATKEDSLANTTFVYFSTLYFIPAIPHLSLTALHKFKFKEIILAVS